MTLLLISTTSVFLIILVIAAIAGLYYYKKQKEQKEHDNEKSQDQPQPQREDRQLLQVGPGGLVQLTNAGPEMKDMDVSVLARHVYREGGDEWYELEGESGEGKVWLDIEEDDDLEVSLVIQRMKLQDIGISPDDLDKMAELEEGEVQYDGRKFEFEESGEADFLRNGDTSKPEKVRYWDLESEDEKFLLGVERWGDNDYRAYLSVPLELRQISILKAKEEN